jgi:hypothetical protein
LTAFVVGDDAALELRFDFFGFLFVTLKDFGLGGRSADVVNRDRQA